MFLLPGYQNLGQIFPENMGAESGNCSAYPARCGRGLGGDIYRIVVPNRNALNCELSRGFHDKDQIYISGILDTFRFLTDPKPFSVGVSI